MMSNIEVVHLLSGQEGKIRAICLGAVRTIETSTTTAAATTILATTITTSTAPASSATTIVTFHIARFSGGLGLGFNQFPSRHSLVYFCASN